MNRAHIVTYIWRCRYIFMHTDAYITAYMGKYIDYMYTNTHTLSAFSEVCTNVNLNMYTFTPY